MCSRMNAHLSATTLWLILALFSVLSLTTGNPAFSRDATLTRLVKGFLYNEYLPESLPRIKTIGISHLMNRNIEDGFSSISAIDTDNPRLSGRRFTPNIPNMFHRRIQKLSPSEPHENQNDFRPTTTPVPIINMDFIRKHFARKNENLYEGNFWERQKEIMNSIDFSRFDKAIEVLQKRAGIQTKPVDHFSLRLSDSQQQHRVLKTISRTDESNLLVE